MKIKLTPIHSTLGATRTRILLVRSQALPPIELRGLKYPQADSNRRLHIESVLSSPLDDGGLALVGGWLLLVACEPPTPIRLLQVLRLAQNGSNVHDEIQVSRATVARRAREAALTRFELAIFTLTG